MTCQSYWDWTHLFKHFKGSNCLLPPWVYAPGTLCACFAFQGVLQVHYSGLKESCSKSASIMQEEGINPCLKVNSQLLKQRATSWALILQWSTRKDLHFIHVMNVQSEYWTWTTGSYNTGARAHPSLEATDNLHPAQEFMNPSAQGVPGPSSSVKNLRTSHQQPSRPLLKTNRARTHRAFFNALETTTAKFLS